MLQKTVQTARRFWLSVIVCIGLLCLFTIKAYAANSAQLRPDMTIMIDGAAQTFYNVNGQEVHPILCDGTTYLPVRAIGEVMGKNVDWNQTTKTITLAGTRTTAATAGTPDSNAKVQDVTVDIRSDFTIVVDSTTQTFKDASGNRVYPMLYNGSTYLPLRAVGELMGKTVAWDSETKTVTMTGSTTVPTVTDADSFSSGKPATVPAAPATPATPTAPATPATPATPSGLITVDAAKTAALNHAKLSADQVTFSKQKLDWEDGRQVYDIEFYTSDYKEYDYEIDAQTGTVLSFDYDADSFTPPAAPSATGTITQDKAREIALAKVPGATARNVTKLKTDRDDGRLVYEIEIIYNEMEYDFEINAADGTILEMESESIYD